MLKTSIDELLLTFRISQGTVATFCRWGGQAYNPRNWSYFGIRCTKIISLNRFSFDGLFKEDKGDIVSPPVQATLTANTVMCAVQSENPNNRHYSCANRNHSILASAVLVSNAQTLEAFQKSDVTHIFFK